ncbi:HSP20-like chaperone [Glarea lozoyensis ATCC 20868]|uniref:HSP20-like chaperone n=2 Tax=Glarea lozoyensis TaxID=101852 RepID=S3D6V4_GLAL2|nr:HSP20-like chaperone [Glarea lozoyensis ATCC 20868]EHK97927.1 putative protein SGT1 like protein A [Glarea lozoyensis 74030]EPE33520.1 HSP20-like chaperone [Glarea lozoyensis ATCC 20868]
MSAAARGQTAFANGDYPAAIEHFTIALKEQQSPLWLIQRSTAYQRTKQHELALADADNATLIAIQRARREQIATAQFRRAVALHAMGRFGDARLCLNWCHKKNEKEKGLTMWIAKIKKDYDAAGGDNAECNKTTVKEIPEKAGAGSETNKSNTKENVKPASSSTPAAAPKALAATPKEKIRHEWYQSPTTVTIEVFAKGVPKDKAEVVIEEGNLEVRFPVLASDSTYDFTASPLFSRIDPSKSSFRITSHKIEIVLHKAVPGTKWSSLEGTEAIASASEPDRIPAAVLNPTETAPVYPTSSKTGPKNWEKLAGEEKDDDDDDVNGFFKKLYKGADDDTRRAMMKSYQESNGTALSTSWGDVGSKKYETTPPDGMEAKKWES